MNPAQPSSPSDFGTIPDYGSAGAPLSQTPHLNEAESSTCRGAEQKPGSAAAVIENRRLFPMLLAPIDHFFLADDSPEYPMASIIHMDFDGRLDRSAFSVALQGSLDRHPMLRAVIRPGKRGLPCWTVDVTYIPQVIFLRDGEPLKFVREERIDLTAESGLRIWVAEFESRCRATFQVHHACTDGTGVYRFLGDLWALYGQQTADQGQATPELNEVDVTMIRARGRRMADPRNEAPGNTRAFMCSGLREAVRVFRKRGVPVAKPDVPGGLARPGNTFPHIATVTFNRVDHEKLRTFAAQNGAMLNDLLMAEMFRAVQSWNESLGAPQRDWLRIMMPTDLRTDADYTMSAANMTAYTFLSRKPRDCTDVTRLVRGVREETGRIKHGGFGERFSKTLTMAQHRPDILRWLLQRDHCFASAILSNLGDPTRRFNVRFPRENGRVVCGNLTLNRVIGVPPLRRFTRVTVGVFAYRRELTIAARCDPTHFDASSTQKFLEVYRAGLANHLA